ncbi:MAG: helix-turn-helix transcriptional regulator [Kutzneria sp.]|nr:helix-turn-helix transcriptional regulator [Kutzneria sp.]MBV9844698.1 helix-turn-helix transcriptional regulator [Kutzneria sp.]
MVRLTRAQQQERTRAAVLAAAREEFAEHGYADARVDRIAERAELTRGAVYSNFPSKRALYVAVLIDSIEPPDVAPTAPSPGLGEATGAFARGWLDRLPLSGTTPANGRLRPYSLAAVFDDAPGRTVLTQLTKLEALLFGLALESCAPDDTRRVRRVKLAELVLTLLSGVGYLAETAPGFGDPFDVARACEHLASLDFADTWDAPHLPFIAPARAIQDTWRSPAESVDHITGRRVAFDADGVIAVLGTSRLEAAEEAVRGAHPGDQVSVVVVTSDPAELGRLVRLRITNLTRCLRPVFGPWTCPGLRLILDDSAAVASALGVAHADDTEAAVRVRAGKITARANGLGAAHAVATSRPRSPV